MGVVGHKGKKISPIELWLFYVKLTIISTNEREFIGEKV
jgi:hypothetical protein